jgi:hypothetical protein
MSINPSLTDVQKRRAEIREQVETLQAEDAELAQAEAVLQRFTKAEPIVMRSRIRMALPLEEPAPLKNQEDKVLEVVRSHAMSGIHSGGINMEIYRSHGAELKPSSLHAVLSKLRSAGKIKKEDGLWFANLPNPAS